MAVSHIYSNVAGDWTGTITGFNSQASTTTIAATALVRPQDWNSAHNQFYTLTGNTTGNSTASGTNVIFAASGPSISIGGSTGTIIISSPPHVSSYENMPGFGGTSTFSQSIGQSTSACVAFYVPEPLSASFLRLPVSMATGSTTYGTTGASLSASVALANTFNAVIYSLGTGASSKSLISVASGSIQQTYMNSISVAANGTQYSITQAFSANAEGAGTTLTTQYSISNTNYSFVSTLVVLSASGPRFLDIPMATSLSAGAYWLIFGNSTAAASTNSTGISAASGARVSYSHQFVNGQPNIAVLPMGATNATSGGLLGAGSFTTAGGGTTSILPISAISSSASNLRPYFQLLRSA